MMDADDPILDFHRDESLPIDGKPPTIGGDPIVKVDREMLDRMMASPRNFPAWVIRDTLAKLLAIIDNTNAQHASQQSVSSPPPSSSPATPPANHPLDGRTHYAECYRTRGHLDCALAEIERLRQLVAGFTQEDVYLLRCLWSSAQENGNPLSFEESNAADLASRIASTLPPP